MSGKPGKFIALYRTLMAKAFSSMGGAEYYTAGVELLKRCPELHIPGSVEGALWQLQNFQILLKSVKAKEATNDSEKL